MIKLKNLLILIIKYEIEIKIIIKMYINNLHIKIMIFKNLKRKILKQVNFHISHNYIRLKIQKLDLSEKLKFKLKIFNFNIYIILNM